MRMATSPDRGTNAAFSKLARKAIDPSQSPMTRETWKPLSLAPQARWYDFSKPPSVASQTNTAATLPKLSVPCQQNNCWPRLSSPSKHYQQSSQQHPPVVAV